MHKSPNLVRTEVHDQLNLHSALAALTYILKAKNYNAKVTDTT